MWRNGRELRRWLMREIWGWDIPRKPAQRETKAGGSSPARDFKYRAWIRTLPCALCGSQPSAAAHTGTDGGMKQKASDYSCVPLCPDCHHHYHNSGKRHLEEHGGLDFAELVRRLNWLWRNQWRSGS